MKRRLAMLTVITVGLMLNAQAEVVLSDDFTVIGGTNADINAEPGGGRNTGTLTTTYSSAGNVISPVVDIDDFFGSGGNARLTGTFTNTADLALNMETNFGAKLAGQVWELTFSHHVVEQGSLDNGWSGFGITDDPAALTPFGDIGVLMRPTSGGKQWVVFTNGAVATAGSLAHVPYEAILDINVTVNEPTGKVTIYYDAFDPVTTNLLGTQILGTYDVAFADSDRHINFRMVADTVSTPDTTVGYYDNMHIETVPASAPQHLFFDSFDTPDTSSVNEDLITRQSNGVIIASYTGAGVDQYAIEGNRLKVVKGVAGFITPNANLNAIAGKDFEFGFKLQVAQTGSEWTSMYLLSANEDGRGSSRIGLYATGLGDTTWAYLLYKGTGIAGADNVIEHVSIALMQEKIPSYNKADEHALKFISTAGSGGTNHYDFVVDGVTIITNIEYAFTENTVRKLETINIFPADGSKNAFYDDLFIKVIQGVTYADWADDNGLVGADRDLGADLEPDGMDNLLEYALGGNPNVADAATILPSSEFTLAGVQYIYNRRVDATLRGLTYGLVVNTDGLPLPWTPVGTTFETGTTAISPEFEAVTNDLPATTSFGFINLEVSGAN